MDEERTETAIRRDRYSGGPARSFLSSMAADERIFEADLAVDRAHVVMLAEQGIVDDEEAGAVLDGLDAVEEAGYDALPDAEDVHEAIETAVIDLVGSVGGKMHTARSRNDEVATCIRYRLRGDVLDAIETTLALREALVDVASEETETVMPGFTHLQPAQPTTVAHHLLSYEAAVARDTERLFDAHDRIDRSPLGAAAFAGTPFDVDRDRTAELLGFGEVLENSMDAASARDFLVETVAALAALATSLSGLSEDLIVFSKSGYVELSDDYASTSSIMPQKKNPDTLELVRATAGDASAGLNGLLTTVKGLPRAYNRDLQRATPHAWRTVDAVSEATDVTAGAIATARWNRERLAKVAGDGFSTATGVADRLAMGGIPFRTAHEIVALAAERHDGTPDHGALAAAARDVLDAPLDAYVTRDAVEASLDPARSVESRNSKGGPGSSAIQSQLDAAVARLASDRGAVEALRATVHAAERALHAEVSRYG